MRSRISILLNIVNNKVKIEKVIHRGQRKYNKYKHIFKLLSCNVRDTD
uniref:Uncharacterized protein n=1 Tax=Medicago truncatula TaxID=3880 RepID=B7FFM3_MEDTR|nr:unknown [Medicago truncatula]